MFDSLDRRNGKNNGFVGLSHRPSTGSGTMAAATTKNGFGGCRNATALQPWYDSPTDNKYNIYI